MKLQERQHGAVTVLRPEGPLVAEDAAPFKQRVLECLASSMGRCVVDASAVPFVDSAGLEALVDANEEVTRRGQALKLCGTTETVRLVLELTGLSGRFEYFADVGAAVRSFL